MNDPILSLQAKLDQAKSSQDVSSDILEIQKQLDNLKLQAEIDPQSISALEKQLDNLLGNKITVSSIEIDETQVQQIGQKIGSAISNNITKSVREASGEISSEIQKIGKQSENAKPSPNGIFKIFDDLKTFVITMNAFKSFENIGKCRMSVRISKYCHRFGYALPA